MAITKERKAEVIWILLKDVFKREGITLNSSLIKRNIGNKAKEINVTPEELKVVLLDLFAELSQEVLNELKK